MNVNLTSFQNELLNLALFAPIFFYSVFMNIFGSSDIKSATLKIISTHIDIRAPCNFLLEEDAS